MIGETTLLARDPLPPEGVVLREVTQLDDFRRIADLESAVWGAEWSWLAADLAGRDPSGVTVLVAEAGDAVVSAAWLVYNQGTEFAGLWGGSTLPGWRGRGIYRALVGRRAQLAAQLGVKYLLVDASAASRPILERLGFVPITTTTP